MECTNAVNASQQQLFPAGSLTNDANAVVHAPHFLLQDEKVCKYAVAAEALVGAGGQCPHGYAMSSSSANFI